MRIVQLTPGTGNFFCGNCMRDNAMVNAMRAAGHDALMIPMYLPHVVDEPHAAGDVPLFFGGINIYLQQKLKPLQKAPRWLTSWLDHPALLKKASDFAGMTSPEELGQLTVSMIAGEDGAQNTELTRMVGFLRTQGGVDVVILSNALLMGLARRLRSELGCRVICTLAGEDAFLDSLPEPARSDAWAMLQQKAADVDVFVPVSGYYGQVMRRRLAAPAEKFHIVYNGIDVTGFGPPEPPAVPTIGFLARMVHGKGLTTLIDAFIELKRRDRIPHLRLKVAGSSVPADKGYLQSLEAKLRHAGVQEQVTFHPNLTHEQKQQFLRTLSVFSVPATYGESFGLYVLEALASGVPVVQPRHAAFPELIERLGGGVLCEPDNPGALADALEILLLRPGDAQEMGRVGRLRVLADFTAARMAAEVTRLCEELHASPAAPLPQTGPGRTIVR